MTARMTTDEALDLLDEVRADRMGGALAAFIARHLETAPAADMPADETAARVALLIDAARVALSDDKPGDPQRVVRRLAATGLADADQLRLFVDLVSAVADADRFVDWRTRTAPCHHQASAALDKCISTAAVRVGRAIVALLYGPAVEVAA